MKRYLVLIPVTLLILIMISCGAGEGYVEMAETTLSTAQRQAINMKINTIENAVDTFEAEKMRKPDSVDELIREGYIRDMPKDHLDNGFKYDPVTDKVTSVTFEKMKQYEEEKKNKQD